MPLRILSHACDLGARYLLQLILSDGLSGVLSRLDCCLVNQELSLLINYDVAHLENV